MTYLTLGEVAARCRVSRRTVARWIASGVLRSVTAGPRRRLVSAAALSRLLSTDPEATGATDGQ